MQLNHRAMDVVWKARATFQFLTRKKMAAAVIILVAVAAYLILLPGQTCADRQQRILEAGAYSMVKERAQFAAIQLCMKNSGEVKKLPWM